MTVHERMKHARLARDYEQSSERLLTEAANYDDLTALRLTRLGHEFSKRAAALWTMALGATGEELTA